MDDLVERLTADAKSFVDWNGKEMVMWDQWRSAIAEGDRGSWPRDAFESLMAHAADNFEEAAAALAASAARIEALTEACKSAQRQIELDNHNSAWVILNRAALDAAPRSDGAPPRSNQPQVNVRDFVAELEAKEPTQALRDLMSAPRCHGHKDGDCFWKHCPQLRDNEPHATGRHCPLDTREDYE